MARFSVKCEYDGKKFDSLEEKDMYIKLVDLKNKGKIKDFDMQVVYELQESFEVEYGSNRKIQALTYIPDYIIHLNDGSSFATDVKGADNIEEIANVKSKIWMYQNRSIPIYFIGRCPLYLGGQWVEVSNGVNFLGKLKLKYTKLFPTSKGNKSKPMKWTTEDWKKFFEFTDMYGIFYRWDKTITERKKKVK